MSLVTKQFRDKIIDHDVYEKLRLGFLNNPDER